MATSRTLVGRPAAGSSSVVVVQIVIVLAVVAFWESLAASGLLFQDVVPSILTIGSALFHLLSGAAFYQNLGVSAYEVAVGALIGGLAGVATGLLLGRSQSLASAYEPYVYYLAPTPKIILFPVMIMWFGVGPGSKMAMGALSCFFPIALSAAAGMREIDKTLIRVGKSFRASGWQMVTKIYLPAMRAPLISGVRLGLGVAIIGVLLAETKLSNQGLGFMIINSYTRFDMPTMYALLIVVFCMAAFLNAALNRLTRPRLSR